jgi:hypothetical protein
MDAKIYDDIFDHGCAARRVSASMSVKAPVILEPNQKVGLEQKRVATADEMANED